MKQSFLLSLGALCTFSSSLLAKTTSYVDDTPQYDIVSYEAPKNMAKMPKNVIFMIGDGMGLHQVFSSSLANEGKLNILQATSTGLAKTSCANKLITDSAASGTALATGHKTNYGAVGVDTEGRKLETLVDVAAAKKKSTGVVVTCNLTHATPGSFLGHSESRNSADEIAEGFLDANIDFLAGGGSMNFEKRKDGKNIFDEMKKKGFSVFRDEDSFLKSSEGKVFAVFADDHLPAADQRGDYLPKAVGKALESLGKNKEGFFLMVEGSQIDFRAHDNDLPGMVREVLDFDKAVGVVLNWMKKNPDTLLVITADHETGGAMLLGGDKKEGKMEVNFSTGGHSGIAVPVYAFGPGADQFQGVYENSELSDKIKSLLQGKK